MLVPPSRVAAAVVCCNEPRASQVASTEPRSQPSRGTFCCGLSCASGGSGGPTLRPTTTGPAGQRRPVQLPGPQAAGPSAGEPTPVWRRRADRWRRRRSPSPGATRFRASQRHPCPLLAPAAPPRWGWVAASGQPRRRTPQAAGVAALGQGTGTGPGPGAAAVRGRAAGASTAGEEARARAREWAEAGPAEGRVCAVPGAKRPPSPHRRALAASAPQRTRPATHLAPRAVSCLPALPGGCRRATPRPRASLCRAGRPSRRARPGASVRACTARARRPQRGPGPGCQSLPGSWTLATSARRRRGGLRGTVCSRPAGERRGRCGCAPPHCACENAGTHGLRLDGWFVRSDAAWMECSRGDGGGRRSSAWCGGAEARAPAPSAQRATVSRDREPSGPFWVATPRLALARIKHTRSASGRGRQIHTKRRVAGRRRKAGERQGGCSGRRWGGVEWRAAGNGEQRRGRLTSNKQTTTCSGGTGWWWGGKGGDARRAAGTTAGAPPAESSWSRERRGGRQARPLATRGGTGPRRASERAPR